MNQQTPAGGEDIQQVLGVDDGGGRRRWWWIAAAAALILALLAYLLGGGGDQRVRYRTAAVSRGNLTVTVTATGTLEPVTKVDMGSEISGTVASVNVDFNDRVKVGQLLAKLDTSQLEARLRQSQAALDLARASVREAEATVMETRNKLSRALELQKKGMCTADECDTAQSAFDRAQATQARAQAQVTQAEAQLDVDRTALGKARIVSPINGIVLKRQIEPGQTVAASFQTPVLFTLAETLTQMLLRVAVDEADVGQIRNGQAATFTVDAYPDRVYPATISQIRYAAETINNVVTYGTVLTVANDDLSLRPGMTATAIITVRQINDALLVPNTALRFTPPTPQQERAPSRGLLGALFPRRPRPEKKKESSDKTRQKQVWVLRDGQPAAINLSIGASNGMVSEVTEGDLQPGMELLVDTLSTPPGAGPQ